MAPDPRVERVMDVEYRGTSLIRKRFLLGPYSSRTLVRTLEKPYA
jgi:hypothetical protein